MTDEEKTRYKNIVYRLRVINNKVESLESSIANLKTTLKKSVSINDKGLKEEILDDANDKLNSVTSNIKGYIIPQINNKIYN